jgi:hypothetical protein
LGVGTLVNSDVGISDCVAVGPRKVSDLPP